MIGKTRQATFRDGCGVLQHSPPSGPYSHLRFAPPADLADRIEHFWCESWQFSTAQTREVVPHPCVHLALTTAGAIVVGVQTARFHRELRGTGQIFGVKFRAGAFHSILRKPVCSIADKVLPAAQIFPSIEYLDRDGWPQAAADFLRATLPPPHAKSALAAQAVAEIVQDSSLHRVADLAARVGIGERSLQRLFRDHVGVSARWVINRYRLFEALDKLDESASLADLALSLGYFDQAHFTNDFTRSVGRAPSSYARHPQST